MNHDSFAVITVSAMMIVGALIDGWLLKVPNWLTFGMVLSGWAYWGVSGLDLLGLSLLGTFVAGALLMAPYAIGGMGAGDVKLYAGFGAWMVPLPWFGMQQLLWAFAVSVLLGGVMALAMIAWSRSASANWTNARAILTDLATGGSVAEVSERALARKPTLQLLPYGVPLTIGSLGYLLLLAPGNLWP